MAHHASPYGFYRTFDGRLVRCRRGPGGTTEVRQRLSDGRWTRGSLAFLLAAVKLSDDPRGAASRAVIS